MEEMKDNVRIVFEDLMHMGCPSTYIPVIEFDRLVNEVLNYNTRRPVDFDEVAMRIRGLHGCDAFTDWWLNNPTAKYYWPTREMSIHITDEFASRWVRISGLMNRYVEKNMERPNDVTAAYSANLEHINIKNVIFNDPATIVFWSDGTKTVCTCSEQDTYDPEKGLALCVMKKLLYNNKGHIFNNAREKWLKKGEKKR